MATMHVNSISARSEGTNLWITVNVVDEAESPLDKVRVKTLIDHIESDGGGINSKLTDELGDDTFRFGPAAPGAYLIQPFRLTKEGYTWDKTVGVLEAEVAMA